MSGIVDKIKDAVTGEKHEGTTTTSTTQTHNPSTTTGYGAPSTAGPHRSDTANKLDPRVDSDLSGSRTTGGPARAGTTTEGHGHTTGSTNAGPHTSKTANKLDRVDSDLDDRRNKGACDTGTAGGYETTHTAGSTNYGPHSTNFANKLDPRVDFAPQESRTTGTGPTANTAGTRATGIGTGAYSGVSTGPAPNTAGPHKSDFMNKIDPRVDSDLDGSRTLGGDKTFSGTKDPRV